MDNFMKPIIETYYSQLQTSFENEILKGVQSVGVQVDKERLLQALKDAKEFWHEGYKDGYRAAVWERPRWISVEERLPKDEKPVLAYYGFDNDGDGDLGMMFTGTLSYFCFDPDPHWQHASCNLVVTHWMPLPEPLEVEG